MRGTTLSIVIPAYNESARLTTTLAELVPRAREGSTDAQIIVVDDGSTDGTAEAARRLLGDSAGALVLEMPRNQGKGAAVRAGVAAATGEIIVFMDADLATDLEALGRAIAALDDADVVAGSRAVPGSRVYHGSRGRALMGRAFNRMVKVLTRTSVHDTQCGFKAFRARAAHVLFGISSIGGFAFDAEILYFARILGFRVRELPVEWTAVDGSSVRPVRDSARTAFDLLRVVARTRPAELRARARALGWVADQPSVTAEHPIDS